MADPKPWWDTGIVPQEPFGMPAPYQPRNALAEALTKYANYQKGGGVFGQLFGALPPEPQNRLAAALTTLGELSPGAGVRDMLQSSGDLTRSTMNLDPMGMLAAAGGMGLGVIGAIPGMGAVDDVAKGVSRGAWASLAPEARTFAERYLSSSWRGLDKDAARAYREAVASDPRLMDIMAHKPGAPTLAAFGDDILGKIAPDMAASRQSEVAQRISETQARKTIEDQLAASRASTGLGYLDSTAFQALPSNWRARIEPMFRNASSRSDMDAATREATLGYMAEVTRHLREAGWTARHTSDAAGRASSRYMVSPDGRREVRVSDHELPQRVDRNDGLTRYTRGEEHVLSWNDVKDMAPSDFVRRMILSGAVE